MNIGLDEKKFLSSIAAFAISECGSSIIQKSQE